MTLTLNVEKDELLARAAELEQPMPTLPSGNPVAPCALSPATGAAVQLALNADALRLYLAACEREWQRLAQSLRNAAKAYEEVDQGAADDLNDDSSASAVQAGSANAGNAVTLLCDPDEDYVLASPPPAPPFEYPYYEVRQAATDLEAPDQGVAFAGFARDWDNYQRRLQETTVRFRPFEKWDGLAALAVEGNFDLQRSYVYSMAQLCTQVANQALTVVAAHKWAVVEHPSAYEVSECDKWYKSYVETSPQYIYLAMQWYYDLQKKSEEVLAEYVRRGSIPLAAVNPRNPPTATRIDPPPDPGKPDPDDGGDGTPDDGTPDDGLPDDGLPDTSTKPPTPSTGTPSLPSAGMPPTDNAALTDALKDLSASSAGVGAGMKPASVGGAGGGVGGVGMPSVPLVPAADTSAPAGAPGAARDVGNLAKMPGAGGAMGGGGMGMAPMGGAPGAGQGGEGKSKRAEGTDETLYSEERPWTEGIIGNRKRKDVSDGKESK